MDNTEIRTEVASLVRRASVNAKPKTALAALMETSLSAARATPTSVEGRCVTTMATDAAIRGKNRRTEISATRKGNFAQNVFSF